MSDQQPQTSRTGVMALPALAAAMIASLALWESGDKHVSKPYRDLGGVWTVCDGVTGPDVVPGKEYTREDCNRLTGNVLKRMDAELMKCLKVDLAWHERWALLHWTYNVGTGAACKSTAVRMFNEGRNAEACDQFMRWRFVAGKDCAVRSNQCFGIVKRRTFESAVCHGKLPIPYIGTVTL